LQVGFQEVHFELRLGVRTYFAIAHLAHEYHAPREGS
jgi:hypothetical protein